MMSTILQAQFHIFRNISNENQVQVQTETTYNFSSPSSDWPKTDIVIPFCGVGCYLSQIFCKDNEQDKKFEKKAMHILPKKRSNEFWQWKVEKKILGSAQKFRVGHVIGNI